jgi:pimeloyl-ACP methyl ester carboxylesterase
VVATEPGVEDRFVTTADGRRLHCVRYGRPGGRVAVVCLPGLTRNNRDFEDVAPRLAVDREVVAVSLRGRGRSDVDPSGGSYALDVYVDDVVAVLDQLGLARVVLVGTSLGGLTSLWFAARHPHRVAGVVLNDVGPELQAEGLARIRSYAGKLPPVSSWEEAAAQARSIGEAAFPDWTDADWERAARQRYRERGGMVEADHDPAVASGRLSDEDPWYVFAVSAGIPMLLLRGELTDLLAPSTVERMRAFHPGLEVVEVPVRGHAPMLDEPVAIAALTDFLAGVG